MMNYPIALHLTNMINASDLAQGIYHWSFKQNGSRIAEGKVTVL